MALRCSFATFTPSIFAYTQMDKLNISPYKQGRKAFINGFQLNLLDNLNDFLDNSSKDIEDFIRETKFTQPTKRQTQQEGQLTVLSPELSFSSTPQITHLRDRFELLDNAASKGWMLSTSDLAAICGISPTTIVKFDEFSRWGFTFIKHDERSGQKLNWKVQSPKGK